MGPLIWHLHHIWLCLLAAVPAQHSLKCPSLHTHARTHPQFHIHIPADRSVMGSADHPFSVPVKSEKVNPGRDTHAPAFCSNGRRRATTSTTPRYRAGTSQFSDPLSYLPGAYGRVLGHQGRG
ncbi:hypothetical protein EDB84DRAFT_1451270 [Lactarius hengduanensis]|nr:hypothetical protein EDB84DRAFT_1451270 [Lactarius hengduanensis]